MDGTFSFIEKGQTPDYIYDMRDAIKTGHFVTFGDITVHKALRLGNIYLIGMAIAVSVLRKEKIYFAHKKGDKKNLVEAVKYARMFIKHYKDVQT